MKIEQNFYTSNFVLKKTSLPFLVPTDSKVYVASTYFTDIKDNSVISIEKSGLLSINDCVFIRCICNSDDQHVVNYDVKQSEFIFSHCLSEYCYTQANVFYINLEESNNRKNEMFLSNFENIDSIYQPLKEYYVSLGGKVKISDANFTKIRAYSDILCFGTSDVESFLSFTTFSESIVTDHTVMAMCNGDFSLFCCNFLDLSNILYAVNFYTGNTATISTSNFIKVTRDGIFISENAKIFFLFNCYIDGTKPSSSRITVYNDKESLVDVSPQVFPPFDAFLCSRAFKGTKTGTLCCIFSFSPFLFSSMDVEGGKVFY